MLATIAKRLAFIVLGYLVACYAAGLAIGRLTIVMVPDQLGGITQDSGTANNSLLEAGILSMPVAMRWCPIVAGPSAFRIFLRWMYCREKLPPSCCRAVSC